MPSEPMRLDEPGMVLPYVENVADWKRRFARRVLELDDQLDPNTLVHFADGLALSARWRLMAPEEVAEKLYVEPLRPSVS
jgi:hypothetical protein